MNIRFFALLFLCIACKVEVTPLPEEEAPLTWTQGRNDYNLEIDSATRNFVIHVPASYDETSPVPLVLMLHGSGGDGAKFYNISKWVQKADEQGFIAVFPTALEYILLDNRRSTKWSAGGLEEELAPGQTIKDDIGFIEELVEMVKASFEINARKVYISGFSNGGGFVKSSVVPRLSHVFAAANFTGGVGIPELSIMQGNRIMPCYNISGSMDAKIRAKTGVPDELPLSGADLEGHAFLWKSLTNMCEMLQLDTVYTETPNPPAYNLLTFDQGLVPESEQFVFVMVKGMEHVYPNGGNNSQNLIAVNLLWPWFDQFELP
ncbi:MAG: PHB depolymerase family esterase [Bacteroidota bacterium]